MIFLFQIQEECTEEEFVNLVEILQFLKTTQYVIEIVMHNVEQYIRCHVAPAFWEKFEHMEDGQRGFELFKSAVDGLYASLTEFLPILKKLEYLRQNRGETPPSVEDIDIEAQFKLIVRATLLSQLPLCHESIIEHFYKIAFNVFCNSDNSSQGKLCKHAFIIRVVSVISLKYVRHCRNMFYSRYINQRDPVYRMWPGNGELPVPDDSLYVSRD